jgi:hypothetical protein
MLPHRVMEPEPTPENGREGESLDMEICSFWKAARLMRLRAAPPSTRTWYNLMLAMVGETTNESCLTPDMFLGQSKASNTIDISIHHSTQHLDDAPGRDAPGAAVDALELLAALIVIGLRVEVAVDDLDRPLGVLKLHLLLVVALTGKMMLAFPLAWRRAVMVGLLLLLLCKLLDLLALLDVVTPVVVHRVSCPTLIAARELARSLVASWASTPTSRCCDSGSSGSASQQLVVVGLLPILVLATALSSGICFRLVSLPCHWSRLGVPCMPFCSPGAFICQIEELRDVFHLLGGQLLEHLLISHVLSKSDNNRSIEDVGDGVLNLGEPLDEGP